MALTQRLLAFVACVAASSLAVIAPPAKPTRVFMQLALTGLRKIDAVDSSFVTDAYIVFAWRDDRLAGVEEFDPNTRFTPSPEFLNAQDPNLNLGLAYSVFAAGDRPSWVTDPPSGAPNETWIAASGRVMGSFVAELQLEDFPFDKQMATLYLESSNYRANELVWVPVGVEAGLAAPSVDIAGWDSIGVTFSEANHTYPALQETYSRLSLGKLLRRQSGYYLSRIVSNIILLVIMAAAVAFLRATEADRLGFVQASFLGVVSWLFVMNAEVPRVGYLTRLDAFIQTSFAAIFAMFIYHALAFGYFKTIDRCLGRPTDDDKEEGSDSDDDDTSDDEATASKKPTGAAKAEAVATASGTDAAAVDAPATSSAVIVTAVSPTSDVASPSASTALQAARVASAAAGGTGEDRSSRELRVRRESARRLKEQGPKGYKCTSWPFTWHGSWEAWNPHRKLDFIAMATIMVVYGSAVAGIIAEGQRASNAPWNPS